jgi:hypothetical protein
VRAPGYDRAGVCPRGYPPAHGPARRLPNGLRYRVAHPSVARDLDGMHRTRPDLRADYHDPREGVSAFEGGGE